MMNEQEEALFFFRKLVFVLYNEIGSLTPSVHAELAAKADIRNSFFHGEKQKQAAELYHLGELETDPAKIILPFRERTGLTLEDVHRAFVEGRWQNRHGAYNFGGPKMVRIAEATLELRRLIESQAWEEAANLVYQIKKMKTNQGIVINQFEWTERRRP